MTQTSYPFDSGPGGNVTEDQWGEMASAWRTTGVLAGIGGELAVSQRGAGANKSVDVAAGSAWIEGTYYQSDAVENLGIADNATGNPRIDLVVVERDATANTAVLVVVQGTPAATPAAPALTQNATLWQEPLAAIDVAAAMVSIVTADIRDQRQRSLDLTQRATKEPVRVATTVALAASTVVGIVRTANANGALGAIDGVTLVAGDRLLDKDHATGAQRGIWQVLDAGAAGRPFVLQRPRDFDSSSDVRADVYVTVAEGTANADTGWLLTTNDPIVLGTTALTFTQFPGATTPTAYGARVRHSIAQSMAAAATTVLAFDQEAFDSGGYHDNAVNNSRLTVPAGKAGKYHVYFSLGWSEPGAGGVGARYLFVYVNGAGAGEFPQGPGAANAVNDIRGSITLDLAVGDYVQLAFANGEAVTAVSIFGVSGAAQNPVFGMDLIGV